MSLFCVLVINDIETEKDRQSYVAEVEEVAKRYKRGVNFCVDWDEPALSDITENSFVVNVLDYPGSNNCELFLQPDDWLYNGYRNREEFEKRMCFLNDVLSIFKNVDKHVALLIGESGTPCEEVFEITLEYNLLVKYLTHTIGLNGAAGVVNITVLY